MLRLLALLLLAAWPALAQDLVPPRVIELPEIAIEGDAPESVEARVLIDVEGHAVVEACDASEAICAQVRDAIARARFEPARRGDVAIPARIAVRMALTGTGTGTGTGTATGTGTGTGTGTATGTATESDETYSARAEVVGPVPGMHRLTLAETRDLPGAFGDPFRAIDALPGVTPALSGLPYFYVRGAPPASTLYVYDDVPVPALYHLAAGPAVIHPRMVGAVRLYAGVPPSRYGRLTGGAVVGEGPDTSSRRFAGELELRLLDVTGYAHIPVGESGTLDVAGRYGYPGLLLSIFSPEIDLAYWDYQTRLDLPTYGRDRFQLVIFGSYDSFSAVSEDGRGVAGNAMTDRTALTLQFHRVEARYLHRVGRWELGSALRMGFEESALQGDDSSDTRIGVSVVSGGPRMWLAYEEGTTRLRLGADIVGSTGDVRFAGDTDLEDAPTAPVNPAVQSVPTRSVYGAYGQLAFSLFEPLVLELGVRADLWLAGGGFDGALDPRVRLILSPEPGLDVHLALGAQHQPAVFFLPVPGLSELAVDYGLQRSLQTEIGAGYDVVDDLRAELQLFVHRYDGLLFPDFFFDGDVQCGDGNNDCAEVERQERISGTSYGGELFVRKPPGGLLSGFLSYTLAWADLDDVGALQYTPSYDVRHVLNGVLLADFGGGFTAGLRLHLRSGKVLGQYYIDLDALSPYRYEQRLPAFVRLDLQVAYAWPTSYGRMRLALELFNSTFSREPIGIDCDQSLAGPPAGGCPVTYTPAIVLPNISFRVEIQ